MNDYVLELDKARKILGSYDAVGKACGGISGKAVMKWRRRRRPPRTEYSGETDYARLIAAASDGAIDASRLLPKICDG